MALFKSIHSSVMPGADLMTKSNHYQNSISSQILSSSASLNNQKLNIQKHGQQRSAHHNIHQEVQPGSGPFADTDQRRCAFLMQTYRSTCTMLPTLKRWQVQSVPPER